MNESYRVGTRVHLAAATWVGRAGVIRQIKRNVGGSGPDLVLVCFDGTTEKPETLAWVPEPLLTEDDATGTPLAGGALAQIVSHLNAACCSLDQALRWFETIGEDDVELNIIRRQLDITCRELNEQATTISQARVVGYAGAIS